MRAFIDVATQAAPLAGAAAGRADRLYHSGLLFLVVAIVQQTATVVVAYVGKDLGWRTTNALRADLARHCLRLDMSFHNARTPGEMIERIDGDVNSLSNFFSQFVVQVLGNALLLLGVLALLFEADWRAGLAMALFSAITLAIVGRLQGFGAGLWNEHRQARAEMYGFLEERLAGTEDIRSCGATAYVMRRFYQLLRTAHQKLLRAGTLGAGITVNTADVLFGLGSVTALAIGAILFHQGAALFPQAGITIGTVYLILHYNQMLSRPIREVTHQIRDLQQAGAGVTRVRDNLTLFDSSIPDERIERAIRDLGMGEWLAALPEGLDTELASGGGGLSAGEAQLLALARILMQDPGLVILDEASSRLDPATTDRRRPDAPLFRHADRDVRLASSRSRGRRVGHPGPDGG